MATSRLCCIPNCGKRVFGHGWCSNHYQRWRKHGDPTGGRTPNGEALRFLTETVLAYEGDDCLIWPYLRTAEGYGRIRNRFVSRIVCETINGPPPSPSYDAAHSCGRGNEGCVSPRHLSWKTRAENVEDSRVHGTISRGTRNGHAKLSEDDVRKIRELAKTERRSAVARRFRVSRGAVDLIVSRKNWAWLE